MADHQYLSNQHLDMLWKATQVQHVSAAVYEVLGNICNHLALPLQLYLLKLIQEIAYAEYTPKTITLLAQFHSYHGTAYTELKLKTLNVLWQLIQDDTQVDQAIVDAALNQLHKLTASYTLKPHRSVVTVVVYICIVCMYV